MNRPNELIKELQEFNEDMFGYELSKTECKELTDYISKLETKYFDLEQELECIYSDPKQKLEECITDLDIKNQKLEEDNIKLERALDYTIDYFYSGKRLVVPHTRRAFKDFVLKESEKLLWEINTKKH